jgi:hypothetical protein
MSIKALSDSPRFHEIYTQEDLQTYVSSLSVEEVNSLEQGVYSAAISQGVVIADWDRHWGHHHLWDDTARLVHVIFEKKRGEFVQVISPNYPTTVAHAIADQCPLFLENMLKTQPHLDEDFLLRAKLISTLQSLNNRLCDKYPALFSSSNSDEIKSALKGLEIHYLTLPKSLSSKDVKQFDYLTSVIAEILSGNYDEKTAQIILERLLRKEAFHPTSTDLCKCLQLKSIHKMTVDQIHNRSLQTSGDSLWKSIYVLPSPENRKGKFKPLNIHAAMKEVYAAQCDRLCGSEMTAPTGLFSTKNLSESVNEVKKLFDASAIQSRQKKPEEAEALQKRAFALFNRSHIPQEVRNYIFGAMYAVAGDNQMIDNLGEKLFYNADGYSTSDEERSIAIRNYLNSEAFAQHAHAFHVQGSVQTWFNHCERAYDLIVKEQSGGNKLKTAPKTLVHFYALLGIIKGSMDCSSGNTLVEYNPSLDSVVNFWDFDDERSMPLTNHFWELRMWQMGLPQSAEPFDRAVLLMFLDPCLKEKLKKQQSSLQIPKTAYQAQLDRLDKLTQIFQEELTKPSITLTPRELFFKMFGGQEEFNEVKSRYNRDKTFSEDGIRISPIEIFEFHLGNMGKGSWYTGDPQETALIGQNMRALYFPNLP